MCAIRFIPARRNSLIRPAAWISSSNAWPRRKPRRRLRPKPPARRKRSSRPHFTARLVHRLRGRFLFCMGKLDLRPHIDRFARRFAEVEAALNDPKAFDNPQRAQELAKEYARLKELTGHGAAYLKTLSDLEDSRALVGAETDPELLAMAKDEVARLEAEEKRLELELQRGIIPP